MSEREYLILMVATAFMTIAVLTIATLAAAELLPVRRERPRSGGEEG